MTDIVLVICLVDACLSFYSSLHNRLTMNMMSSLNDWLLNPKTLRSLHSQPCYTLIFYYLYFCI